MKPTVIASGVGENPSGHHPSGNSVNPADNISPNGVGGSSAPSTSPNSRQFPQFQTGFGFDPDDDLFSDAALRSRLNRFRDPFSFARKRCGNSENPDDPYSRYFDDDSDFFPNFGSLSGRRRAPPQNASATASPFFEHIPAQFRHYIPDDFGFPNVRTTSAPQPQYQQQGPQQHYETYVQPPSPTAQPPQQKPKLCDAAIQTEDLSETDGSKDGKNLKQYGMRNTVDLGQKSPPEECRGPRSHSAPPPDNGEQSPQGQSASNAAQPHPPCIHSQTEDPQHTSQGTQPMTPPHPPPRQHAQQPQYTTWQQHQQQVPQQPQAASPGGGFTRTVPIFVEGRSDPAMSKNVIPPQQQQPPSRPSHPQKQRPEHPSPLNTQQPTPAGNQLPPQTPHTTECISKIQAIQRDVLDLMSKVEHFQGMRGDKEYMYLDEMLTRNLLKLDTIDTNGKDSIRLARREAIKCIQASINVLEAKSEENAKTAQPPQEKAVIDGPVEEVKIAEVAEAEGAKSEGKESTQDEAASLPPENVAIPLPPPPTREPPAEASGESKKVEEGSAEETKPEGEVKAKEEGQPNFDQKTAELTGKEQPAEKEEEEAFPVQPDTKPVEEKTSEQKSESSLELRLQKPEPGTEGENPKPPSTGAVKKKIVKRKKAPAEAASPPENTAPEISQTEKTEQKSDEPTHPQG